MCCQLFESVCAWPAFAGHKVKRKQSLHCLQEDPYRRHLCWQGCCVLFTTEPWLSDSKILIYKVNLQSSLMVYISASYHLRNLQAKVTPLCPIIHEEVMQPSYYCTMLVNYVRCQATSRMQGASSKWCSCPIISQCYSIMGGARPLPEMQGGYKWIFFLYVTLCPESTSHVASLGQHPIQVESTALKETSYQCSNTV